jgi:hypothetical protein
VAIEVVAPPVFVVTGGAMVTTSSGRGRRAADRHGGLEREQQLHGFSTIVAQDGRGIGPALAEEDEAELFHCAATPHSLIFSSDSAELERRKRGARGSNKYIIVNVE